jgi:hypothetical protein
MTILDNIHCSVRRCRYQALLTTRKHSEARTPCSPSRNAPLHRHAGPRMQRGCLMLPLALAARALAHGLAFPSCRPWPRGVHGHARPRQRACRRWTRPSLQRRRSGALALEMLPLLTMIGRRRRRRRRRRERERRRRPRASALPAAHDRVHAALPPAARQGRGGGDGLQPRLLVAVSADDAASLLALQARVDHATDSSPRAAPRATRSKRRARGSGASGRGRARRRSFLFTLSSTRPRASALSVRCPSNSLEH